MRSLISIGVASLSKPSSPATITAFWLWGARWLPQRGVTRLWSSATANSRPLTEQNGAIVEINAAPGLRMHIDPSDGTPRDVGGAIIDSLFPESATLIKNTISTPIGRARAIGRIPIISITGTNGKT